MKSLAIAFLAAFGAAGQQEELKALREEKLEAAFLKKIPWVTDYTKALEQAKKDGKLIFAFFTRSYSPCPPCQALEAGALLEDDFVTFARDYVPFCHVTSGVEGDKHQDLLQQKGGTAFPHLLFMDSAGMVMAVHEGRRTVEEFSRTGDRARENFELKKRAEGGDAAARAGWAIARLEMSQITPDEADAIFRKATVSAEQQKRIDALKVRAEVRTLIQGMDSEELQARAARRFYEMRKSGRPAPPDGREYGLFWGGVLDHAEKVRDAAIYEEALKALKEKFGSMPENRDVFREKDETLRKLKEGGK